MSSLPKCTKPNRANKSTTSWKMNISRSSLCLIYRACIEHLKRRYPVGLQLAGRCGRHRSRATSPYISPTSRATPARRQQAFKPDAQCGEFQGAQSAEAEHGLAPPHRASGLCGPARQSDQGHDLGKPRDETDQVATVRTYQICGADSEVGGTWSGRLRPDLLRCPVAEMCCWVAKAVL